ncbi:MAG: hypothetical protein WC120_01125 [Parcubacteria group bacterium]
MAEESIKQESDQEPAVPQESLIVEDSPLQKLLKKSDVLLMLYPKDINGNFYASIEPEDEITIYELLKEKAVAKKSLVMLLDTGGGNVYSAVKIMDTLRTKYDDISIAIPQEAKSSGTMMCCGADKLIMCPISELGPLDKPMVHPDNETSRISALDIVKSIDGIIDTATDRQKTLATEINSEKGIPLQKSFEIAGDFVSKLISPMLCKEDVKIYNQATRLLMIADTYGSELLQSHMLKYVTNEKFRKRMSGTIIRRLVWLYPDHGFAIRRGELKEWFFNVEDAEDVDYWDELWKEFKQNVDANRGKIIKFIQ